MARRCSGPRFSAWVVCLDRAQNGARSLRSGRLVGPAPMRGFPGRPPMGSGPSRGLRWSSCLRLLRVEFGVGLRDGDVGLTLDVHPDWWGVL
jgi:hypothetical protein